MWYDILVFDSTIGWIPVNIKTTTKQAIEKENEEKELVLMKVEDVNILKMGNRLGGSCNFNSIQPEINKMLTTTCEKLNTKLESNPQTYEYELPQSFNL